MDGKNRISNYTSNITVSYGNRPVAYGDRLTKDDTVTVPIIRFKKEPGKLYAIIMVDPDAPSTKQPYNRHWLHMLIVNRTNDNEGILVNDYQPPNPPTNSGTHRYYICIFEQEYEIRGMSEFQRSKFDVAKFTNANGLKLISCTKFTIKSDTSVKN
jgi:phosphatidylethanolamine-binding protein